MTEPAADESSPPAPRPAARKKNGSGSQRRKKLNMVTTAYDDTELAALDDAASRAGLTRASYQRVQTLATPPKTRSTRRAPVEREMLAKALGQLGRVGNNLNQLARAANIDRTEREEIMITVAELRGMLPAFMQALGRSG